MIRCLFYIIFTVGYLASYGQEENIEKNARLITKFSYRQLSGGVILVQAKFNKIPAPLNFIMDTGSGAISLDSSTTKEFNIPHVPSGRTINGIAGIREVDVSKNNTLTFPGLVLDSQDHL